MSKQFSYLIIGGSTKAATTSLFNYLASHPQVCASSRKESRFFLDPDYPVPLHERHVRQGADGYERLFDACPDLPFRLEATPDYLASPGSAELLHHHLEDVRIVFMLRDPIERLQSWYTFARQNNDLPAELTFEDYVARQFEQTEASPPQHWRALEQGRYLHYLGPYLEHFDPSQLFLLNYHTFVADVRAGVQSLCRWSGLSPAFYDAYDFTVHNRSQEMRSPGVHGLYRSLRRSLRRSLGSIPILGRALRAIGRGAEPFYLALNRGAPRDKPSLSIPLRKRLEQYYRDERSWLASPKLRLEGPIEGHGTRVSFE